MEYKKSKPSHGKLNGRYVTFYEYEFPRATRKKGPFLPQGAVRLREFLYSDGEHDQLVQIVTLTAEELAAKSEQRLLVDKMLDIKREDKRFTEGELTSEELTGEVREYSGKKMISLRQILAEKEKIGLFASARLVRDSRKRKQRAKRWKTRIQLLVVTVLFIVGVISGSFLQQHGFFALENNAFYQDYIVTTVEFVEELIRKLAR